MTFVESCIEDSLPVWESCLETEFLQRMADGTLNEECLKGYIVDDSLYLREYAKVFAWGIIHAASMDEVRAFYELLTFVNESEDATRLKYLKYFGLSDGDIQSLSLRAENRAYINTMLEAAQYGESAAECMMACLPCMISYCWIFRELLKRHPDASKTICGPLIMDYTGDAYEAVCRKWIEFTDSLCISISDERRARCREIFRKCSEHEYQFWLMSARARDDL